MSLFKRKNQVSQRDSTRNSLAEVALTAIHDGVVITNRTGVIAYLNPAASTILGCSVADATGLDVNLLLRIESTEGRGLSDSENRLLQAIRTGQSLENYKVCLIVGQANKRIPVAIAVVPVSSPEGGYIITFRDITKELAEEGEQAEFISTASHEMRTPVASIEGYLSLALNPQTATIDERARTYLNSAHAASQHLGQLFRDLLDITQLDDGHLRPNFQPVELVGLVKQIADGYLMQIKQAHLSYQFGATGPSIEVSRRLDQVIYGSVDVNFIREIIGNLLENAIKYTPAGGSIYISVIGDGDHALINITDTGMGISSDDLPHIFQKFYRADNSDTRTIGGTGLGLYLVKQRVEAMGVRVWAESAFNEGSTFYVSLPRITGTEYEKRMIAYNTISARQTATPAPASIQATPAPSMPTPVAPSTPLTTSPPNLVTAPISSNNTGGIQ